VTSVSSAEQVARLHSRPLDRGHHEHRLWEIYLIHGLPRGSRGVTVNDVVLGVCAGARRRAVGRERAPGA
jgi:hypothetical protein